MHEEDHGHSVAAWTGVVLVVLGSTLISLGIFFSWAWANWSGTAVVLIGLAAWYGLVKAGYGESVPAEQKHQSGAAAQQD